MEYTKIPKDRVGALIGKSGETKAFIERKAKVRIKVDSETGEVSISERFKSDPLHVWVARDIVSAIGRGFSPEKALMLNVSKPES
jgi:ribosomal RNA assembly protein